MSRGPRYTEEEKKIIKAICEDNPKQKPIEKARTIHRYGQCLNREETSLAQFISRKGYEVKETDEDFTDEELELKDELTSLKKLHEELIHLLIEGSQRTMGKNLEFDYIELRLWLREKYRERYWARYNHLKAKEEKDEGDLE